MSEHEVKQLITKAANAEKSDDAMKFSQAACNAATALCALESAKHIGGDKK
jgi:hypothetical protein